jgi:hypothetical protein
VNGVEATNPIDIICVPMPATLTETPDLPTHQRAVLNFAIPSGLLQGAYQEGKVLDLYANFPAEFIVKRDPQGNWCKWNGTGYDNSLKGQGTVQGLNGTVYCMAEGPDGKIYVGGNFTNAGGDADADYIARWNPTTEAWEAVGSTGKPASAVTALLFTPEGDLIVGGVLYVKRYTLSTGSPSAWTDGSSGSNFAINFVKNFVISPSGLIYAVGFFTNASGTKNYGMAYSPYSPGSSLVWGNLSWSEISSGERFNSIVLAPNGSIVVGGKFTDLDGVSGATNIALFNGTTVTTLAGSALSGLNDEVNALAFGATGNLYVGGAFTNAGGVASADYIAKWTGSKWESLGTGTNGTVNRITVNSGKVYISGSFTSAGGLTLTDRVAVWSNGSWLPLDIDLPGTGVVYSILPASDGSLYIGGNYSTTVAGENAKTGVVALNFEVASASANTYPVISITGPGTLKSIINYRTGKSVMFDGLTLQAGEWISLNFDPLQLSFRSGWAGRGNLMRYVIAGSDYGDFYVSPGANYISLFMDDTDANSKASITYVPKFWGLDGALL